MNRFLAITPGRAFFLVFLFIAISYSSSLYSPLVLDDLSSFIEVPNVYIDSLSLLSLNKLANSRFGPARLIPIASFAFDHYIGKGSIVQFHLTNIMVHMAAACALFFFLQGLLQTQTGKNSLAFIIPPGRYCLFVAALWSLTPIQTNCVTYLVQRMTSLAALFYLAALAFYIYGRLAAKPGRRRLLFCAAFLSGLASLFSKENSATLPFMLLLVEIMFISPGLGKRIVGSIRWYHWCILVCIIVLLLPLADHPWQKLVAEGYQVRPFTLRERLLTQTRVVAFYLSLLALPLPGRMNLDHDFALSLGWLSPATTILSFLFLLALFLTGFLIRKRYPLISFGIFWFFLALILESTVIPLEIIFEHRLYLPSVGFYLAVVSGMDQLSVRLFRKNPAEGKKVLFLFMIILASVTSLLTTWRNFDWRDTLSIYQDCANKSPNKPRTHVNLGIALGKLSRYEEALAALERAIALGNKYEEDSVSATNNIMVCYIQQKKYDEAISRGEKFLREGLTPEMNRVSLPKFFYNWGYAYYLAGRYWEALAAFSDGSRLNPQAPYLHAALEEVFAKASQTEEGRKNLGLSEEPAEISLRLAEVALNIRDYSHAKLYLYRAKELAPDNANLLHLQQRYDQEMEQNQNYANQTEITNDDVCKGNIRFRTAMALSDFILNNYPPLRGFAASWLLDQAAAIAPDHQFVLLYRVRWYMKQRQPDTAIQELKGLLARNPDFVPALSLAGRTCFLAKQGDKAAAIFSHLLSIYPAHPQWQDMEEMIRMYQGQNGEMPPNVSPDKGNH